MGDWKLADAKNKLSEVIDKAEMEGIQTITRHGEPVAVVMSYKKYTALRPTETLTDVLTSAPRFESDEEWDEIFGDKRPKRHARPDPFQDK